MTTLQPFRYVARMICTFRPLLGVLALLCLFAMADAQESEPQAPAKPSAPAAAPNPAKPAPPAPVPAKPEEPAPGKTEEPTLTKAAEKLAPEELASAAKVDALTIPTPGELMAALSKHGKPDWSAQIRPPIATNYTSRAQMALNLGGLIADGYLAVEAQDAQQVKNIGRDIMNLAKPLGVQQDILNRGKSLTEFAEQNQWDVLKEELEATQNEVKSAMSENKDQDLVTLVTLGGWIRGTEVISDYVAQHYTEGGAKLLRQPAIVKFLGQRVNALPDKMRDDPSVKKTRVKLLEIEQTVSFPADTAPPKEIVQKIHVLAAELVKDIAKKEAK
jgi:hypothetical protein